MLYPLYSPLFL